MLQTVETLESAIKVLQKAIPRCEHNEIVGRCAWCDKCQHGKCRSEDCRECHANDDQSWQTVPITDAEIYELTKELARLGNDHAPWRSNPHHLRNFHSSKTAPTRLALWGILLRDYLALCSKTK